MSTAEAAQSLAWFRSIADPFVAALEPVPSWDGDLSLRWSRAGIEYTAMFAPDGSLFLHSEQSNPWEEAAEKVRHPGPAAENRVRDFCLWPTIEGPQS